jgi:DNA polymerase III epsilon subunit-like protein
MKEGFLMKDAITLGIRLFQDEEGVSVAFYCEIPCIKEGYMYMFLGRISQERAFWKGLAAVLKPLTRYKHLPIKLGFSKLMLELNGDSAKQACLSYLQLFDTKEFGDSDIYSENLEKVNQIYRAEGAPINKLMGISKAELEKKKTQKKNSKLKISKNPRRYYDDFIMPREGVVLDFECTSNIVEYARFIQVAALKFKNGQVVERFNTFVNPGITIPRKIRELTGITKEDVEHAPNSFEAIRQLNSFLKGIDVIVGHNIEFDYSLLETFCKRFNIPLWNGSLLCTRRLAKDSQIVTKDYRLQTLCELFGIKNKRPHRADSDVEATYELMCALYQTNLLSLV